jgi:hypothetical protein
MLNVKKIALVAVALAGTLGAGLAEARGRDHVEWSITIGNPAPVYFGAPAPVFVRPAPIVIGAPVHVYERGYDRGYYGGYHGGYDRSYHHGYRGHGRGFRDADGDGIPNRYDRVYNPRWDRDGDGIPNRYDRYDNSRHHHGGYGGRWHGR